MHKNGIVLMGLLISLLFIGCSESMDSGVPYNQRLDEFQQEFVEKNGVDVICSDNNENEEIVAFENSQDPQGYGIASFYIDNETDEIKYEISEPSKFDENKKVEYMQIRGKDKFYIGIFIGDKELSAATYSIKVTFATELSNQPTSIQQTINDINAQIISYESDEERTIISIQLLNANSQEIYEIN